MNPTRCWNTAAKRARITLFAGALSLWSMPAPAQARVERLSDKDVKALIEQVDEGRDKFEGNLDGKFKGSVLRGPSGETKVEAALQDYQDNTKKLKDRFNEDYSGSAEVATVLKQSTAIDTFMKGAEPGMKGRTEWDRQAANIKRLAEAYGTTFPFPTGGTARRINDKEAADTAKELAEAADSFKDDLEKVATLPQPDKDAAKKEVEALIKQADLVKSRTNDGKPATTEVKQLVDGVARIQTFANAHSMPANVHWQAVQTALAKLQQAFGLTH